VHAHIAETFCRGKLHACTKLQLFGKIEDKLTVRQDAKVILCGGRILMPNSLRQRATSIAHEGYQGFIKTKLLCEKVWFPKIDHYVKEMINQHVLCQASGPKNRPDRLQMSPLPPEPWHTVHMDFCGPFPTGDYLFVVNDAYS